MSERDELAKRMQQYCLDHPPVERPALLAVAPSPDTGERAMHMTSSETVRRKSLVPDQLFIQESDGLKFSPQLRRSQGAWTTINADGVTVAKGQLDFRRDGLYLRNITPTPEGLEWNKTRALNAQLYRCALPEKP